jgi:hypothetical protein
MIYDSIWIDTALSCAWDGKQYHWLERAWRRGPECPHESHPTVRLNSVAVPAPGSLLGGPRQIYKQTRDVEHE